MGRTVLYIYIFLLCMCTIYSVDPQPKPDNNSRKKETENQKQSQNIEGSKEDGDQANLAEFKIETEKKDNLKTESIKTHDPNQQIIKTENKNLNKGKVEDQKNTNVSLNSQTTSKTLVDSPNIKTNANTEIESGAVTRGILVFVGITMIGIMYIGFKSYFRRGNKKYPLIKKYGVRTRRSDVEMEPLPLEEDEDDETVFDLGHVTNR